jgi:hypothetical protein
VLRTRRNIVAVNDPAGLREETVGGSGVVDVAISVDHYRIERVQVVVGAELGPGAPDYCGRVQDVAQTQVEAAPRGMVEGEIESRFQLSQRPNRHVVDEERIRLKSAK